MSVSMYAGGLLISLPREQAAFYRIIVNPERVPIEVRDYTLDNKIYCSGHFTNQQANIKEGQFVYYSANGFKTRKEMYKKGLPDGEWIDYYSDTEFIKRKQLKH